MAESVHDFSLNTLDGKPLRLADYADKTLLLVNTASKCGLTPQYGGLQKLHDAYAGKGLAVVGFPCNQFGAQEPGSASEIGEFCKRNYGVSFTLSEKIDVNGAGAHPLYKFLKSNAPTEEGELADRLKEHLTKNFPDYLKGGEIKWNFTKFLVDRSGKVVARFAPTTEPEQLKPAIEAQLRS